MPKVSVTDTKRAVGISVEHPARPPSTRTLRTRCWTAMHGHRHARPHMSTLTLVHAHAGEVRQHTWWPRPEVENQDRVLCIPKRPESYKGAQTCTHTRARTHICMNAGDPMVEKRRWEDLWVRRILFFFFAVEARRAGHGILQCVTPRHVKSRART